MGFFWPRPRYPQAEGPRVKLHYAASTVAAAKGLTL